MRKLIRFIDSARKTLHVCVYCFTHRGLLAALVRAKKRGVRVYVIVGGRVTPAHMLAALMKAKILTRTTDSNNKNHTKIVVVDRKYAAQGPTNWTVAAASNFGVAVFAALEDSVTLLKMVLKEWKAASKGE